MKAKPLIGVLLIAVVTFTSVGATTPRTVSKDCKYFKETGHYVCDQYLDFFRSKGGLETFGFPLTEAFHDPTHAGLRVQYFQRARMEIHPDDSGGHVLLGLLVDELGYSFPSAGPDQIPPTNTAAEHYFPETEHVVSHAFLDAFRGMGGLEIFGYPRSEFFYEDGTIVQYFQRARMEWRPDRPSGSQIELTNLGEMYLERFGVPGDYDEPVPPPSRMNASAVPDAPEQANCQYFAETGHYVCDRFLDFFNAKGQLHMFGHPLTEAFYDPDHGGLLVQYFQRARMEFHPHNPDGQRVLLGLLADELGYVFPPLSPDEAPASNTSTHRYFPETQHVVCHAFLDTFLERGGLEVFGYPRSEIVYEDGHIVQYFQRSRMEWHPEGSTGSSIQLTNLGEIYLERFDVPDSYRRPQPPGRPHNAGSADSGGGGQPAVIALDVSASVEQAIVGPEGTQTVFVHASSPQGQPVENAGVTAVVTYPNRQQRLDMAPTNERGFTKTTFELLPSPAGEKVIIEVTVTYGGVSRKTQTSFLRWH
jgi:hypothetical protein